MHKWNTAESFSLRATVVSALPTVCILIRCRLWWGASVEFVALMFDVSTREDEPSPYCVWAWAVFDELIHIGCTGSIIDVLLLLLLFTLNWFTLPLLLAVVALVGMVVAHSLLLLLLQLLILMRVVPCCFTSSSDCAKHDGSTLGSFEAPSLKRFTFGYSCLCYEFCRGGKWVLVMVIFSWTSCVMEEWEANGEFTLLVRWLALVLVSLKVWLVCVESA